MSAAVVRRFVSLRLVVLLRTRSGYADPAGPLLVRAPGTTGVAYAGLPTSGGAMNKPLWICCLVGAALGIALGLAIFDSPVVGVALGLGVGAVVGAGLKQRH